MMIDQTKLTMSQAAQRLGVSTPTVWRWRDGVRGRRLHRETGQRQTLNGARMCGFHQTSGLQCGDGRKPILQRLFCGEIFRLILQLCMQCRTCQCQGKHGKAEQSGTE